MSGPKVITIVTKDEIIDLCSAILARVDAALQEWLRVCARNNCLDESVAASMQARRDRLEHQLAAERFGPIQKHGPALEQLLRDDLDQRLDAAAHQQAEARSAEQRRRRNAQALLTELAGGRGDVGAALHARLQAVAAGAADDGAVREALSALTRQATPPRPDTAALAERLRGDRAEQSWDSWLASHTVAPAPAQTTLERHLAELSVRQPTIDWANELDTAMGISEQSERRLALDVLAVRVSRELAASRALTKARDAATAAAAALTVYDADASSTWNQRIAEATTVAQLDAINATLDSRLHTRQDARAAQARRDAVLQQLANLGYEVSTDMAAAWVSDGRIVIEKPTAPGYGVEVSGGHSAARIQVRPVALTATVDTVQDQQAETAWCSDVDTMRAELQAAGGDLVIERSTPVGATPVKRVAAPPRAAESRRMPAQPRQRQAP